ncbi:septum formation initiator family protein [Candidatus Saccharibacteria bacterium]|nr:septum formation initiator family protein [Candidatus Saccharibacteria bacterium]
MRKLFNYSKILFWFGLLIAIYMFAVLASETSKNYTLRARSDALQNQIDQLQVQIEQLGYKITYYQTDSYKERIAREKLGLQAPGEGVVITKSQAPSTDSASVESVPVQLQTKQDLEAQKPNPQQWWDFLLGS